jgi:2-polyprenyl-3-methyl-5-hydroxy-6-metoxy-1,4-benzoquinol methylase
VAIYNEFAKVYDGFMKETPYAKWAEFILQQAEKAHKTPKIMCDLGCGTGTLCEIFAKSGIDMIGIDNAEEMLMQAREHARDENLDILYLLQDMADFELYGTVDVMYSACDSLNYLLEEDELLAVFRLVNNYLEKDGLFIFDMNTPYKYEKILGSRTFCEQLDDAAYIWENYFDEEEQINEFSVNFFIQNETGTYDRTQEFHYQKAYSLEKVKELLKKAGLELVAVYDDYTEKPSDAQTERMVFVAKEGFQKDKFYTGE